VRAIDVDRRTTDLGSFNINIRNLNVWAVDIDGGSVDLGTLNIYIRNLNVWAVDIHRGSVDMRAIHIHRRAFHLGTIDVQVGTRSCYLLTISNGSADDSESVQEGKGKKGEGDDGGENPAPLAAEEVIVALLSIGGGTGRSRACNNLAADLGGGDDLLGLIDHVGSDGLNVGCGAHH
jgi:hypothetical protein